MVESTQDAKLREAIASGQVVFITGTGVSVAACGNQEVDGHKVATWMGLLEHGAHALKDRNTLASPPPQPHPPPSRLCGAATPDPEVVVQLQALRRAQVVCVTCSGAASEARPLHSCAQRTRLSLAVACSVSHWARSGGGGGGGGGGGDC